ncbi:hypothetical protein K0651_09165 [Ornithinimicrobium sp. Arc0846-15]|nr:hypothetical protein [Ornithinimicrobium laminariae]
MPTLPASVRVALWATAAIANSADLKDVAGRALPDMDHVDGLHSTLEVWRDLGERVVLVGLPRSGDTTSIPQGSTEFVDAAVQAEEAVYVPGIGAALVPEIKTFGPDGDQGWQAQWTSFSVTPVPQHRVQQADLPDTELMLRRDLATFTSQLSGLADPAFGKELVEDLARDRMGGSWGLPTDIPRRAERVIELAGSVLALADAGRDPRLHGVDVTSTRNREMLLNRLADRSAAALVVATNVAAMHLGGWR